MTVDILRTYADYVSKLTMFTIKLTEWLASPGGTKFAKRNKKCQKKNWMFVSSVLTSLRGRKIARIAEVHRLIQKSRHQGHLYEKDKITRI